MPQLPSSEKDRENRKSDTDDLLLEAPVYFFGTASGPTAYTEPLFTLRMWSNGRLVLVPAEMRSTPSTEMNLTSGSGWLGGNWLDWLTSEQSLLWADFCEALCGKQGITKWRGSVLNDTLPNGKAGRYVITFNPAYAQRELKMEPVLPNGL